MASQKDWTRDQQLLALNLYLSLPFGRLSKGTPEVIAVAKKIGRTPSSVAMKACNFASLDESFTKTGRKGLEGASAADRKLWAEFIVDRDAVIDAMQARADELGVLVGPDDAAEEPTFKGPTEALSNVKVRRGQQFFSRAVRSAYGEQCAVTGLAVRALTIASHIIPWSRDVERRTDPSNGLLLNALLDRAFDKGLITFDEQRRLVCAKALKSKTAFATPVTGLEGVPLRVPERSPPDEKALAWHREHFAANF